MKDHNKEKRKETFTMMFQRHQNLTSENVTKPLRKPPFISIEVRQNDQEINRLCLLNVPGPPSLDTLSKSGKHSLGLLPSDTAVGDGDTVLQLTGSTINWSLLSTLVQVRLNHNTN